MEKFGILILAAFFAINSLDKAESVKLELKTFDEIFGEGWWDKGEAEDLKTPAPTNFGQNVHHQIDRQNTQIGQIEPNSTDQNPPLTESDHSGQIEPNSTDQNPPLTESDHSGQIEPNSTDQNPPLTESDHSDNAKNGEEINSNENITEDERKRKIVDKFHAIKDEISFKTIYTWKKELGQSRPKKYSHSQQKELMKRYYEFKDQKPKIRDEDIAKMLKIGTTTLYKWKSHFRRQQFHPNSVDGHSVEENASANVQGLN
uniref:Homeobox domain-containing protein n=1 Tax=Globodera rostochiensis TaxID=31243 RepID=A0A914HSF2_GLORO